MKHGYVELRADARASFPGLLGRGLIEAKVLRFRRPCPVEASPVYWAGASLKHAVRVGSAYGVYRFPGLLGRGLIEARTGWRRPWAA